MGWLGWSCSLGVEDDDAGITMEDNQDRAKGADVFSHLFYLVGKTLKRLIFLHGERILLF
jgi:hypothetical protein